MNKNILTFTPTNKIDYALFSMSRTIGDGDYEEHRHSSVEVMLVLGGRAGHVVNGVELDAQAGDVFVIHPNMSHALRDRRGFDEIKVGCMPGAFAALAPELTHARGFNALFVPPGEGSKDLPWLRLGEEDFAQARRIALAMLDEYDQKRFGWQAAARAQFCLLLAALARASIRKGEAFDPALSLLNGTISYMEANFARSMTLTELARKAGMSKSQFVRVFHRSCGTSPVDYLIGLRLDHACRLMLSGDKSMAEIAYECGFDDSNYFSRQFKRRLGVSPREYRQGLS